MIDKLPLYFTPAIPVAWQDVAPYLMSEIAAAREQEALILQARALSGRSEAEVIRASRRWAGTFRRFVGALKSGLVPADLYEE